MGEGVNELVRVKVCIYNNTVFRILNWAQNLKVMLKTLASRIGVCLHC